MQPHLITLCLYLQIQSPKEPGVETDSSNWPSYYHGDLDDDDTYFDEEKIAVPEGMEEKWFSWRMLWAFTGMDCQVRGDCQKQSYRYETNVNGLFFHHAT